MPRRLSLEERSFIRARGIALMLSIVFLLLVIAMIYRFAPNVEEKFRFLTAGAVVGVILLIGASLGFASYVSNFANYAASYGSLGAIIILMMWLYMAGLAILVGSEINVVIEHHGTKGKRKRENTTGPPLAGEPAHGQSLL